MNFPFMDYVTVNFDEDAGTNTIYTTVFTRSLIQIEFTDLDLDANEEVEIYANHLGNSFRIFYFKGTTLGGDGIPFVGSIVVPSGVAIRISSTNENNIQGQLHVFELPSAS